MSQRAPISAGLIARKGGATTSSAIEPPKPASAPASPVAVIASDKAEAAKGEPGVPLNFNVPASFKKRFALAALHEDKNHKQFLLWLFDQYEARKMKAG